MTRVSERVPRVKRPRLPPGHAEELQRVIRTDDWLYQEINDRIRHLCCLSYRKFCHYDQISP